MAAPHDFKVTRQASAIATLLICSMVAWPDFSTATPTAFQTPLAPPLARPRRVHIVPKFRSHPLVVQYPPHLRYYGGPVISNVGIVFVLYGTGTYLANVTGAAAPTMTSFYQQLASSAHLDWLCEYDTNILDIDGAPGTHQIIRRGNWVGTVQIAPDSSRDRATITDAQIEDEMAAQIDAGHLPAPSANTLYMIHFPAEKSIELDPYDISCEQWCGYHSSFTHNGVPIRYGVLPDMSGDCSTGCGGNTPFGSLTITAWHELIESITDPDVGVATAWYDTTEYSPGYQWGEIGDICSEDTVTVLGYNGVAYLVQELWSNAQNACAISGPACATTAVDDATPGRIVFSLACANPVIGPVRFRLELSAPEHVELSIYDVAGRRVEDLLTGELNAGDHALSWAPHPAPHAAGVYFARLTTGGRAYSRAFILLQ
jgi:hypothetical protein